MTYMVPEWKNKTELTNKTVKYFEGRGISQGTLNALKVYSDNEYLPQFQKQVEVICFPYFVGEKLVNVKCRGPQKSFKLHQGAELVLWNIDSIDKEVIIVEGEIDLLSVYEAGMKSAVSVPAGANTNLEYLDNYINRFDAVEKVFLATDNDKKGVELRDELARRLGFEKCCIVDFKDCKDANEFMVKYGAYDLKTAVMSAKPYPVKGIVKVSDIYGDIKGLYENGIQPGLSIRSTLDGLITWESRRLAIITGIPGHGKSELVDFLIARLNALYGWKVALFSPENYPLKFHYAKLFEKLIGKKFSKIKVNEDEFNIAYEYIRDNFFYIMDEDDYTIDLILEAAKSLIKIRGIKILVIDPYNKLEYQATRSETETQYISRLLDKLQMFARFNDVLVILVAHPRKMNKQGKIYEVPSLYDISGSAHFYNKADYGLSIYRLTNQQNTGFVNAVQVHVQKVKFKHLGTPGMVELRYNYNNGRFEPSDSTVDIWDNSNWLVNGININSSEEQNEIDIDKINENSPY
jgi:twinkle protein